MTKKAYRNKFATDATRREEKKPGVPTKSVPYLRKAKPGEVTRVRHIPGGASVPRSRGCETTPQMSEVNWLLEELERGTTDREILEQAIAFFARDED